MSDLSWRATFWFCFALGLFIFTLVFFVFPETYRDNAKFDQRLPTVHPNNKPVSSSASTAETVDQPTESKVAVESNEPSKFTTESTMTVYQEKPANKDAAVPKKSINPIAPFLLLRHPFVFLAAFASGVAFGTMFAIETITPDLYEVHYGFNSWQTGNLLQQRQKKKTINFSYIGLSYLGGGIGNLLGAILTSRISDKLLLRARKLRGGQEITEDRLTINLWPAFFICMPFGTLLYGWTVERGFTVWAPIIGFGILNFGMNQIMTATSAYLVDAVHGKGASVTAAANLVRMVIACVLTIAANPMVAAIGPGYTCVFLACFCFLGASFMLILKLKGEKLRHWSGY